MRDYGDVAAEVARDLTGRVERAVSRGVPLGPDRRRPRARLRQARRAQRRGAGRRSRRSAGARPAAPRRPVAQVVPGGSRRRRAGRRARLADRRRGDRRRARRRAHRARARRAGNGAGGARRRYDSGARHGSRQAGAGRIGEPRSCVPSRPAASPAMSWLDSLLARPPVTGWDVARHRVVALIVYELLKLIRGTRAIADGGRDRRASSALFYFSRGARLQTVNWLIRNVVGYVVFAAIVLLQNDIRRALAHFGAAPFVRVPAARSRPTTSRSRSWWWRLDDAGRQADRRADRRRAQHRPAQLHRERHPARRHGHLRSAGQRLPADLAAARRRGDRPGRSIAAAACFLPLTRQPAADPRARLAASRRHRRDRGERRRRPGRLRGDRQHLAGPRRPDRARPHRRDAARPPPQLVLKRTSAGRAAGSPRRPGLTDGAVPVPQRRPEAAVDARRRAVVAGRLRRSIVERDIRVALELSALPDGLEIVGDPPDTVDVRLRGPASQLSALGPGDVVGGRRSRQRAAGPPPVQPDLEPGAPRPFGVEVVQVTPATLSLAFESAGQQVVPVRPAIEGTPGARATASTNVSVDPVDRWHRGPGERGRRLDRGDDRAGLGGRATTLVREAVALELPDSGVRLAAAPARRW